MIIPDSEKKVLADFKIVIPELTEWKKYSFLISPVGFFAENGHITKLTLSRLNLTELPNSIGDLKELRLLNLSSNRLKNLPESFQNLNNLEILHLNGNSFRVLPKFFGNLINLRELFLGYNILTSLPEQFGNLINLRKLFLGPNKISVLPESFRYLNKIRGLELGGTGLRSFSNIPKEYLDEMELGEDGGEGECFSSKGNYPSKHAKEILGKNENMFEICDYYSDSPLELAAKYIREKNSLSPVDKDRLAWEGGFRERRLIEEGGIEPNDPVLAEINKRLTMTCNNGLELIK